MNHHNLGLLQIPYYLETYDNVHDVMNVIIVGLVGFAIWTIYKKAKKNRSSDGEAQKDSTDDNKEES